ncbi:hypothetical protein [Deinococcus aquaticus]|uniref:hypothetical protein n=1 Tax=Deinococcus aquaticus TaxID=328692 RepID=UPI003F45D9A7
MELIQSGERTALTAALHMRAPKAASYERMGQKKNVAKWEDLNHMENGNNSVARSREERALDKHREAVRVLLAKAFRQALQKKKVVVRVPPGYGKTHSAIQQIAESDQDLRVLWFSPEVRPGSVASRVVEDLKARGVNNVQHLHRLSELPQEERDALVQWDGSGKQVKVLAHAYIPLLFHEKPSAHLSSLRKATLIIIDENPLGSLISTCGFPSDHLLDRAALTEETARPETQASPASAHLPLYLFLEALEAAGHLKGSAQETRAALETALGHPDVRSFRSASFREIRMLGGPELGELLRTLLIQKSRYPLAGIIKRAWLEKVLREELDVQARTHVKLKVRRHLTHLQRNIKQLMAGADAHGLSIIDNGQPDGPVVRCAYFQKPSFRRYGVLHLDAFADKLVVQQWLDRAKIQPLPFPKSRPAQHLELTVMRTPHEHDTLPVQRSAVTNQDSQSRHVAVVSRGLQLLGDKVLILSHQGFNQQFKGRILEVRRSDQQQIELLHWKASLGVDRFKGYDALVLNDSRLPRSVIEFDYAALPCNDNEKALIKHHLEVSDFLQLLHRVRPLLYREKCEQCKPRKRCKQCKRRATILTTFDPLESYVHPSGQKASEAINSLLLDEPVRVIYQDITTLRGKSKHVTFLELARLAMKEALDAWQFIPVRLLVLLAEGPSSRTTEAWDSVLLTFIESLSVKHPVFRQLAATPKPVDTQRRGMLKLLNDVNQGKSVNDEGSPQAKPPKSYDLSQVHLKAVVLRRQIALKSHQRGPKPQVIIWIPKGSPSVETVEAAHAVLKKWNTRFATRRRRQAKKDECTPLPSLGTE